MQQSCLKCHNDAASGSAKTDWKVGDVRGVLEVIRPLDQSVARAATQFKWTFGIVSLAVLMMLLSIGALFALRSH
jgi:adenylate cyclase